MKIRDFTKPEIDKLIELCNFTDEELEYFMYRTKDVSNVAIAQKMYISESKVSHLARRVKKKIIKVL